MFETGSKFDSTAQKLENAVRFKLAVDAMSKGYQMTVRNPAEMA